MAKENFDSCLDFLCASKNVWLEVLIILSGATLFFGKQRWQIEVRGVTVGRPLTEVPIVWWVMVHVCLVVSDPLQPYGSQPASLLCPWDSPRQAYWSGLPFPSPGDLSDPGIEPVSRVSPCIGRWIPYR